MPKIIIDTEKCKGCFLCIEVCPKKLISKKNTLNTKGYTPVEFKDPNHTCAGCAFCAIVCPDCCISVEK